MVPQYVGDGAASRIEAVVSLDQTGADEPVSEGLLPDSGGPYDQHDRPVGVTIAEKPVQLLEPGGSHPLGRGLPQITIWQLSLWPSYG